MTTAPILHTDRLILRPHSLPDFDDCLALWQDPGTVRFIGGQVQGEQAVWFRLLRYAGQWALLGHGFWVFEDRATGAFLGEGGLIEARRGIPELEGAPEVGWALAQAAQGRGIATEAVDAIVRWADAHVDAPCTRCIIEPENEASIRVAQKCGFVRGERLERDALDNDGTALILFERPRLPVL